MANRTAFVVGLAGVLAAAAVTHGASRGIVQQRAEFAQAHPAARLSMREGRISRVYGTAFSSGQTAAQSAESFLHDHAGMFGVEADEVVPRAHHVQPVMYDRDTGTHKFTAFFYRQERQGIPVFRSNLKLLVRNEPGNPLVLASANLRELGTFEVEPLQVGQVPHTNQGLVRAQQLSTLAGPPQLVSSRKVIWAGVDGRPAAPRLADEMLIGIDVDRWLIVADAMTGAVLHEEHRIYIVNIDGNVSGNVTQGVGADFCEPEVGTPLPYLVVSAGSDSAISGADGDFTIVHSGTDPISVTADLDGRWFDVFSQNGAAISESDLVTPPGPATLFFNSANTSETERAQVNGYVHANMVRDWALQYVPTYPEVFDRQNFPVTVNRTDGFCPGNAWFSPTEDSINFCLTGAGYPNTAWSSVVYHEYGHHLVESAFTGQGAYGEGSGDVVSILILDDPAIGLGFFGTCNAAGTLRTADNSCQYSLSSCSTCGSAAHDCGNLISGCVWSTREELVHTEPTDYLDILSSLALNAILIHTGGSSITPDITVDYMTLDDDDAEIGNGTPHYAEIQAGFSAHNMAGPDLELLTFNFPGGLPETITPGGGTTASVAVSALTATPEPDTGKLVIDTGSGFVEIPMTQTSTNNYDAEFPAAACGTAPVYYFTAETTDNDVAVWPAGAPVETFSALSAEATVTQFTDDFENDMGWTTASTAIDGQWGRGVPIPLTTCDRGNPGTDADGSGQCYLTDNSSASACNSDVDDGVVTLTSPVMDASGPEMSIQYWRWYHNTAGSLPAADIFEVEIFDGTTWVNLETVGPSGPEVSGGWIRKSFRVADFITPTDQFQIRFMASDLVGQGSIVEAAVDGVELVEIDCGSGGVFGDLDGDNVVGVTDLLIMLGAWGPCPDPCPPYCVGDIDEDCNVGVTDLLALLGAWTL